MSICTHFPTGEFVYANHVATDPPTCTVTTDHRRPDLIKIKQLLAVIVRSKVKIQRVKHEILQPVNNIGSDPLILLWELLWQWKNIKASNEWKKKSMWLVFYSHSRSEAQSFYWFWVFLLRLHTNIATSLLSEITKKQFQK